MMRRTKKDRRSYSAGERGRNRFRVFPDHATGIYRIEWRHNGKRCSESLEHRDWERAKRQADDAAANYVPPQPDQVEPLTLGTLFEMYLKEVTPEKGERSRSHDRRTLRMFEQFFGGDRDPMSLCRRDWDRFVKQRTAGAVGPSKRRVSARTVERDLRLLLAVLNWAEGAKHHDGTPLLHRHPLRGLKPPKEKNPNRVVLTEAEYEALLSVAEGIDWRFHVALVLAHETGHRIGAIRKLRWSDIDLERSTIRWRAENEKTGYGHVTPATQAAMAALEQARRLNPAIGDAPVLPAAQRRGESVSRYLTRDWWERAEARAGLEPKRGRGWHSLRRKFASDLMDRPLKVLCELGGWKSPSTVLQCYQHPDADRLREALEGRKRA